MNKAITDGLALMPARFGEGLDQWSSGDGLPGDPTYDGAANAALVSGDQDFGTALELTKTAEPQKLRYTGQTPFLPGMYLQVRARVKAVSGNLPGVRIAAWAGDGAGAHVPDLVETGPEVQLTTYGEVVEVRAILGAGNRGGVDMIWGTAPAFAHLGLDLTGPTGGVVRIDDIVVEDVTRFYLREMMDWVDVRDHGAIGDGVSDDSAAFAAADAAAGGRGVLVPAGTFHLGDHVSMQSPVRFEGMVTMPADKRLTLLSNFDLPSYVDAFGDELEGLSRAMAVLFNFSDHDSLDMKGMSIEIDRPIDVQAMTGQTSFEVRRVLRNGRISALASPEWDTGVVTSQASYAAASPLQLTGVVNIGAVPVGALVEGPGVGREVYVRDKNVGAGTLTLSQPLFDAEGTQVFTFRRFRYMLDFGGFAKLSKFVMADVELQCNGLASAGMLAPSGQIFHLRDSFFIRPKDRAITSIGDGCQGMLVDRCQFLSNEQGALVQDRTTVAFNVNADDTKIRDNRAVRFRHFAVMAGSGHLIASNHWFQGDTAAAGLRSAGLVLTDTNVKTTVGGNYIDNAGIEWTNEHDEAPEQSNEFSFGGLSVSGNIFVFTSAAPFSRFFVVRPMGAGHFVQGLSLSDNVFKAVNGAIERVDAVDTTFAGLDFGRTRNLLMAGNSFNGIDQFTANPMTLAFNIASEAATWTLAFGGYLPLGGRARNVTAVVPEGPVTDAAGTPVTALPFARTERGPGKDDVEIVWPVPAKGRAVVTVRTDNPF